MHFLQGEAVKKAIERWECRRCGEVHPDEDEARDCCPTYVREVFECPVCGEIHHDEGGALECCPEDEAEAKPMSAAELEAQGQMRLELTS